MRNSLKELERASLMAGVLHSGHLRSVVALATWSFVVFLAQIQARQPLHTGLRWSLGRRTPKTWDKSYDQVTIWKVVGLPKPIKSLQLSDIPSFCVISCHFHRFRVGCV